jgi:hypothetical protein
MVHNGGVTGKYHRIRGSIALLAAGLSAAVGAGLWVLQSDKDTAYWLAGAGVLIPIVTPLLGKLTRQTVRLGNRLDEAAGHLRKALVEQWEGEVSRRVGRPYPLPVPFAVPRQAKQVMDGWKSIRGDAKGTALPMKGTFTDIAEVFTRPGVPRRLVILGEPGTGKSMIAQWLMLELLERTGGTAGGGEKEDRVPFFLPVATWDPAEPLEDWAAARMIETYPVLGETFTYARGNERTLARELVGERRVLMILDGLDEMAPKNWGKALDKLSEAALGNQCLVVTCRTAEYEQIVKKARNGPLAGTPVIELGPLPMSAVRAYLRENRAQADGRWDELLRHLAQEPKGVLATALSTPLAVWLARTVYGNTGTGQGRDAAGRSGVKPARTPTELLTETTTEDVMHRLLGGLVEAAYAPEIPQRYPEREAPEGSRIHNRLVSLARHISDQEKDSQNIDWWRLHELCPPVVIGLAVGLIVGPLLGVAVGLAVGIKAGHQAGLAFGVGFGIVTGVLAGVTCARPQLQPRAVNFRFTWSRVSQRLASCVTLGLAVGASFGYAADRHGGLLPGLVTGLIVGPAAAWAAIKAFGRAPGITAGITAALSIGLAAGLASGRPPGLVAGPIAGLVFMIGGLVWVGLYEPASSDIAVSPHSLLRNDRLGCMVVGLTAGGAFGVMYGLALGPRVGAIAVVALTVVVTLVVSLWGTFSVARVWLAVRCGLPLGIMSFLLEAHERGVLRQVGPSYQFRHMMLHEQLAGKAIVAGLPALQPRAADHARPGSPQSAPPAAAT